MENNRSEASWEGLKEYLKKRIAEAEDQRGLADEETAIVKELIIEPLERATEALERRDKESWESLWVLHIALIMVGWLKLSFLPSQFKAWLHELGGLDLTASFFRIWPASRASDAPMQGGVSQFWDGIICQEMHNWEDAKSAFDLSLKDPSLPPWIRVTALQLKAWHHVRLQEYDTAHETFKQLRENLSVSKPTVDYLMGYIKALEDSGRGSLYGELYHDMFMMVPEAVPGELQFLPEEAPKTGSLAEGVSLAESTIEALKLAITERIEPRLLLGLWQAKEEIIKSMPITHTLEEVSQRLRNDYGDWVSKVANQGALTNAEFLYEALSRRSWSEAVLGYANAVEAEIRIRLLQPLEAFLRGKTGAILLTIGQKIIKVEGGKSNLFDCEEILRGVESNRLLKEFFSLLPSETRSFLLHQLPDRLSELRNLRNPSAHGAVVANAKEVRKLVMGTPEKAGLLKRLTEINIPYTG